VELGVEAGAADELSLELEDDLVSAGAAVLLESALDSVDGESFFDSVVDSAAGVELFPA
jgi:hypothetical protein